jgi:hypothetical protein
MPRLMMSFTGPGQVDIEMSRELQLKVDGISLDTRKEWRKDIAEPEIHASKSAPYI